MCGRYTQMYSWEELYGLMSLTVPAFEIEKRYNIAPTQKAPIIRQHSDTLLHLDLARWGLIPSWTKELKTSSNLINARAETVASKPSFRSAFKKRRCLIPASGYYEWKKNSDSSIKQPYYIKPVTGILLFAGIWEAFIAEDDQAIETYAIITTQSNQILKSIHDRMPVIIEPKNISVWLDCTTKTEIISDLLGPLEAQDFKILPVSTLVNNPRNDHAECVKPVRLV